MDALHTHWVIWRSLKVPDGSRDVGIIRCKMSGPTIFQGAIKGIRRGIGVFDFVDCTFLNIVSYFITNVLRIELKSVTDA